MTAIGMREGSLVNEVQAEINKQDFNMMSFKYFKELHGFKTFRELKNFKSFKGF